MYVGFCLCRHMSCGCMWRTEVHVGNHSNPSYSLSKVSQSSPELCRVFQSNQGLANVAGVDSQLAGITGGFPHPPSVYMGSGNLKSVTPAFVASALTLLSRLPVQYAACFVWEFRSLRNI